MSVTVKSSKDFPLDLYYLMDFSHSMKDDLTQLRTLSQDISTSYILSTDFWNVRTFRLNHEWNMDSFVTFSCVSADSLYKISPSYGIGLGTFVDKPTFPYAISGTC